MTNRLTIRSDDTSHENGVCCTHFLCRDCTMVSGRCSDGCPWEEAAWSLLADYEDTGKTPEEVRKIVRKYDAVVYALRATFGTIDEARLQELAFADKAGRITIQKHGHWSDVDGGFCETLFRCSCCGEEWCMNNDDGPVENGMLYCPNCGAMMDEPYEPLPSDDDEEDADHD